MHNSKKKLTVFLMFVVVCLLLNSILDYILIPNNIMRIKMHNLETRTYDDLFLGTSHGFSAVDPLVVDSITDRKSTNLCVWGEYPRYSYYLLKEACRTHKPEQVIYELDPTYWINKDIDAYYYTQLFNYMPWSGIKAEYFLAKITSADFRDVFFPWFNYQLQWQSNLANLELKKTENYKNYGLATFDLSNQTLKEEGFLYVKDTKRVKSQYISLWNEDKILSNSYRYFDKIVSFCKENDIELLVFTTPVPQETLELYPENYQNTNQYFSKMMNEYGIAYYNFNYIQLDGFDKSLAGYSDYDGHMFGDTAGSFSKFLGSYVKK